MQRWRLELATTIISGDGRGPVGLVNYENVAEGGLDDRWLNSVGFRFFVVSEVHCLLTSSMLVHRLLIDVSLILLANGNGSYNMTRD